MAKTALLIIYLNGQRELIGEAVFEKDGAFLKIRNELMKRAIATTSLYGDQVRLTQGSDNPIKQVMTAAASFGQWQGLFEDQGMDSERAVARKAWVSLKNQIKGTPLEELARDAYGDAYSDPYYETCLKAKEE